jgi:hypothetical protein
VTAAERRQLIIRGVQAADETLASDPGDVDALACKMLLLRLQAASAPDGPDRAALARVVDGLRATIRAASFTVTAEPGASHDKG